MLWVEFVFWVSSKIESSGVLIKLVLYVASVKKSNGDELLIAVVVGPVGNSCGDCDDVTFSEVSELLVTVFRSRATALYTSL